MAKITAFLFTILAAQMSAILPGIQSNEAVTSNPSNAREVQVKAFLDKTVEILKEVDEFKSGDDEAVKEVLRELSNIKTSLSEQNGSDDATAQVEGTVIAALRKLQISSNAKNILVEMERDFPKVAFFQKFLNEIRPAIYQTSNEMANQMKIVAVFLRETLQHVYVHNLFHHPIAKGIFCIYSYDLETIVNMLSKKSSDVTDSDVLTLVDDLKAQIESLETICKTISESGRDEIELQLRKHLDEVSNLMLVIVQKLGELPEEGVRDVFKRGLIQYVTVSYNFYFQIEDLLWTPTRNQNNINIEGKIEILGNDVVTALELFYPVSDRSNITIGIFAREFVNDLEDVAKQLEEYSDEETEEFTQLAKETAENIRKAMMMLKQVSHNQGTYSIDTVKLHYVDTVEQSTIIIQQLLRRTTHDYKSKNLEKIVYDFVATLKHQLLKLQSLTQSKMSDQTTYLLVIQIQIVTNNLAFYTQDIPFSDASTKYNLNLDTNKWELRFRQVIERLENEVIINSNETRGIFYGILKNFKKIRDDLNDFPIKNSTLYEASRAINTALQNIVLEFKVLAWYAQQTTEDEGNLDMVTKSVLVEYLIHLYYFQNEINDVIYMVQRYQSPKELAIQIQTNTRDLIAMLGIVLPDNSQIQHTLIWPTRKFSFALENIIKQLKDENLIGKNNVPEKIVVVVQQALMGFALSASPLTTEEINQLTQIIAIALENVMSETQNLELVDQSHAPVVKNIMMDLLASLQSFHVQLQTNLQIFDGKQTTESLREDLQVSADRMLDEIIFIEMESDSEKFNPVLTTVLKELNVLKTTLGSTPTDFSKLEKDVQIENLCAQLYDDVLYITKETNLILKNENPVPEVPNDNTTYTPQDMTAWAIRTFTNNLIQLTNVRGRGAQQQENSESANQIQFFTDQLPSAIASIVDAKQETTRGLVIQALSYARHIENIVEKLEDEANFNVKIRALQKAANTFKLVPDTLKNVYAEWRNKPLAELKSVIVAQTQNVNVELGKLMETKPERYQDEFKIVVRGLLVDYLDAVKELYIATKVFRSDSEQTLLTNIRYIRNRISLTVERINVDGHLLAEFHKINVGANQIHDMSETLVQVIKKMENQTVLNEYVKPLQEIQVAIEKLIPDGDTKSFLKAAMLFQSASYPIIQMRRDVDITIYGKKDDVLEALLKEVLKDFLIRLQDIDITFLNSQ